MWMLFCEKKIRKKGHLHVLNFLKNKQSLAFYGSKSTVFKCLLHFSLYLNPFASCRLLHHVLITALEWLWDLFLKGIYIACFEVEIGLKQCLFLDLLTLHTTCSPVLFLITYFLFKMTKDC